MHENRENRSAASSRTGWLPRLRSLVTDSAWAPVAARLGGYFALFVALAAVGSGAAAKLLPGLLGGQSALASVLQPAAGVVMLGTVGPAGPAPSAEPAPVLAPEAPDAAPTGTDGGMDGGGGVTADGKVLLNVASEEELRRLPGIGPSKAKAIVALRAKLGRFKKPEDLLRIRGIGRRVLARLRPLMVIE